MAVDRPGFVPWAAPRLTASSGADAALADPPAIKALALPCTLDVSDEPRM